jgi:hypothetical protein
MPTTIRTPQDLLRALRRQARSPLPVKATATRRRLLRQGTIARAWVPRRSAVAAVWIGEGLSGDFDPTNAEDRPAVRLDIATSRSALAHPYRSYCTYLDARNPATELKVLCMLLARLLADTPVESWRRILAMASWLDSSDLNRLCRDFHHTSTVEARR